MAKRLLITSDRFGTGDDELGRVLMRNFIYSLARAESAPVALMFANAGVRLTCEGSEVLEDLHLLADAGVAIRSCGTCLDYLTLSDVLAVGEVGTMTDLVTALGGHDEIITIA